jgi:hypothetical protein
MIGVALTQHRRAGRLEPKGARFTFRVSEEMLSAWRPFARAEDASVSELITVAVQHYVVRPQIRRARHEGATATHAQA